MGSWDGLDGVFAERMRQLVTASGGRIEIVSGYRSKEDQEYLWNQALAKYGSEDAARQWVAPPGKSNHNYGIAADLSFTDDDAREWAHANAGNYGLNFPMDWEPWHIETVEARGGTPHEHDNKPMSGGPDAYTDPPEGHLPVTDPNRNFDLGHQLQNFDAILRRPTYNPESS